MEVKPEFTLRYFLIVAQGSSTPAADLRLLSLQVGTQAFG
jgi:hypothetical protein